MSYLYDIKNKDIESCLSSLFEATPIVFVDNSSLLDLDNYIEDERQTATNPSASAFDVHSASITDFLSLKMNGNRSRSCYIDAPFNLFLDVSFLSSKKNSPKRATKETREKENTFTKGEMDASYFCLDWFLSGLSDRTKTSQKSTLALEKKD
ncbi:uncharacterized protein B0P05DRAFT_618890 [Gilbertella persicaria]|uniref:uncharacterized protein n=1 Tax=Gilbertella persicaria TaxID=101096 RepID=UPI00221FF524|nr:uncharacterized protein B0P05DRAFT_618890 [Gilbertella persicaria]KAI8072170.1 hypothetical protein B0P05DRAFT_618890 [Gilbertella persicaria]